MAGGPPPEGLCGHSACASRANPDDEALRCSVSEKRREQQRYSRTSLSTPSKSPPVTDCVRRLETPTLQSHPKVMASGGGGLREVTRSGME